MNTATMGPQATIRTLIDAAAARAPEAPYAIAPETGEALTYAALRSACRAVAATMAARGVQPGDRVAVCLGNGLPMLRTLLGLYYGGFVAVPINLLAGFEIRRHVITHSDARLLVTSAALGAELASALPAGSPILDAEQPQSFLGGPGASFPGPQPDDLALLLYTSGTTGLPKGVRLSQANLVAGTANVLAAHALTGADRCAAVLPLYHINAQVVSMLATLASGGRLVLPARFSTSGFWPMVEAHGCTWLNLVPTLIAYLLATPGPARVPSGLRFCRSASAPLPAKDREAFEDRFGIPVIESMGMTETSAPVFCNPLPPAVRPAGSAGLAIGIEVRVVDPATGIERPIGEVGEIQVRGAGVMQGYHKDPVATAAAFDADGWLKSGDLGWRDAAGFHFLVGRIKELIVKGGENIAPREIDEALESHPDVLEAAAFAIPDPFYGQEVAAAVVPRPGRTPTVAGLLAHCRDRLGPYKTPRQIRFVDALPRGATGKVQRQRLAGNG